MTWAAVLLAGGSASRLSGVDKAMVELGGRTVLDRMLDAVAGAVVVVVGPPRPTARPVRWTREQPPGGGPLAGLAAGLAALAPEPIAVGPAQVPADVTDSAGPSEVAAQADAEPGGSPGIAEVAVLAADQPGLTVATIDRLRSALASHPDAAGAVLVDASGRTQWLTSLWRYPELAAAMPAHPAGRAVRAALGDLPAVRVPAEPGETDDLDTPADLTALRTRFGTP